MISVTVSSAGQVSICGKNFNIAIFSDTMKIINVKLCMMVELIQLYPSITENFIFLPDQIQICATVDYFK